VIPSRRLTTALPFIGVIVLQSPIGINSAASAAFTLSIFAG
jgi:hypothetical protein